MNNEFVALASAIDANGEAWPPSLTRLIEAAPDSFDDQRAGTVAAAAHRMREAGEHVNFASVAEQLPKLCDFISSELNSAPVPISCVATYADEAWEQFTIRRAKAIGVELVQGLDSSPRQAQSIIAVARSALDLVTREKTNGLTIRKPDEILAMTFDDSDIILGDRLLAEGQPAVIAGAGGMGKSRLTFQMVAAIISGREFIGFQTGKPKSRWLFLQTENSNRRLKFDLERLRFWLGDDWDKFNAQVTIHTLENDTDGFVNLDSPENQSAIAQVIKETRPDGIIIDPLNEFSIGDLSKDSDMRMTLQALSRLCKSGNPHRAIVVLHHALTGRAGAAKATGHDRASFSRNSKALHAWTRGQINLAPIDPDDNDRLIVACGKCSNGKEFEKFAIKLNPETFIYERDNSVDLSAWEQEMTGTKSKRTASPELVRELADGNPTRAELVKRIKTEVGCGHSTAYEAIERAEKRKLVYYSKAMKTYDRSK